MPHSVRTVCVLALWGMFGLIAVQAQNNSQALLPGDEMEWKPFGKIDPWKLPPNTTEGGRNGEVFLGGAGDAGGAPVGCGVLPYDTDGDVWMIRADRKEFKSVGYILPQDRWDSAEDQTFADCALRAASEFGGFVIDKKTLNPLGISNNGAVYWFSGGISRDRKLDDPCNAPIRSFSVGKARTELKKPKGNPKRKAAMRQALLSAQSPSPDQTDGSAAPSK
ncbi:hypothetical protein CSHISOI_11152 [Colletotrichum shisoi]|uniref:Ecp2 effector protein domain-containing protein n=1 Tax=Colletotrichum shisoi TaxID=2078593 RepID=A0A5Q4BBS8_9PEZI|nr:hypothetical protein CSHISOI_11152 [Colletotrichum shisoi]